MSSTPVPPHGHVPLHAVQIVGGDGDGDVGSGAHVRSLTAGLVARGVRVTVVAPRGAAELYGFAEAGAYVARMPDGGGELRAAPALRAACAGADLVHAHGMRCGLLARLALAGRRTPLVFTWHARSHPEGARARLLPVLERRVARAARVVLAATTDLVDSARHRGARDARLAPIAVPPPRAGGRDASGTGTAPGTAPAAQDDGRLREQVRAEVGAVDRPLVVTAARLEAQRGHRELLDAARMWRSLPAQPMLAIAGEGPERAGLQRQIDAEKLPVRLLGRRDDLPRLLRAADVAVLCSRWEARSLLAQEALHAGAPLVATAVGGVPELVGDAAELVPYGDVRALADAVAALLGDPQRRLALATAGREQTANWPTEDDTVAQVLSVYDELAPAEADLSRRTPRRR